LNQLWQAPTNGDRAGFHLKGGFTAATGHSTTKYASGQKSAPYGVHLLETKGWIRLTKDGNVCVFDGMKDPTEAQSARLVDIALAAFNSQGNTFGPTFAAELNRFLNPDVAEVIEEPPSPFD
jgi:hypothetical protein